MKALLVTTGDELKIVDLNEPLYKSAQVVIEECTCITVVHPIHLGERYCMIADDDGLLREKPLNLVGSILYDTATHGHPIVGNILFMKEEETDDGEIEIVGLSDDDIRIFTAAFRGIIRKHEQSQKKRHPARQRKCPNQIV